jgi:hypothetical protein
MPTHHPIITQSSPNHCPVVAQLLPSCCPLSTGQPQLRQYSRDLLHCLIPLTKPARGLIQAAISHQHFYRVRGSSSTPRPSTHALLSFNRAQRVCPRYPSLLSALQTSKGLPDPHVIWPPYPQLRPVDLLTHLFDTPAFHGGSVLDSPPPIPQQGGGSSSTPRALHTISRPSTGRGGFVFDVRTLRPYPQPS